MEESSVDGFDKIITDFVTDILVTYPELKDALTEPTLSIAMKQAKDEDFEGMKKYCLSVYPEKFFDILYQNDSLFECDEPLNLLPNIDFRALWRENISENTRKTIWKYIQLVLFTVVSEISDSESFGENAKLFEAINEDTFKEKLEETISGMQDCFDGGDESMPDPSNIHDHISGMLDGKLGQFAKEIAEETAEELDVNVENASSVDDVFKKLVKDPSNLMSLVKKVGTRLDDKLKKGDLKESELMAEASEMLNKMKDMPGMSNLQQMFGQAAGGKMNLKAMQSKLNQNMKKAKQRERMQNRMAERDNNGSAKEDVERMKEASEKADAMMESLLRSEGMNADGKERLVFSTGEKYEKSSKKRGKKKRKNKNA